MALYKGYQKYLIEEEDVDGNKDLDVSKANNTDSNSGESNNDSQEDKGDEGTDNQDKSNEDNDNSESDNTDNEDDFTVDTDNADDSEQDEAGATDSSIEDDSRNSENEDEGTEDNEENGKLGDSLYQNLTPEEKANRDYAQKQEYLDMHHSCNRMIGQLNHFPMTSQSTKQIKPLMDALYSFKTYISYYLNHIYSTKSYLENHIKFIEYLQILDGFRQVFKEMEKEFNRNRD